MRRGFYHFQSHRCQDNFCPDGKISAKRIESFGHKEYASSMNKSSESEWWLRILRVVAGKKVWVPRGTAPWCGAVRRGAERHRAERGVPPVTAPSSRLVSVYLYAGTTYVPAERESGSIAGALSHTLSFSPSIGPERGHEKRLINRTNTGTFLPRDIEEEREKRREWERKKRNGRTSSSDGSSLPRAHHTLRSRICVRGRGQDERRRGAEREKKSLPVPSRGVPSISFVFDENRNAFLSDRDMFRTYN